MSRLDEVPEWDEDDPGEHPGMSIAEARAEQEAWDRWADR